MSEREIEFSCPNCCAILLQEENCKDGLECPCCGNDFSKRMERGRFRDRVEAIVKGLLQRPTIMEDSLLEEVIEEAEDFVYALDRRYRDAEPAKVEEQPEKNFGLYCKSAKTWWDEAAGHWWPEECYGMTESQAKGRLNIATFRFEKGIDDYEIVKRKGERNEPE